MKNLKRILIVSLVASQLMGLNVHAEKMSSESQDLVIQKLERIISNLEKQDSSYLPTQLRLADLYSERARSRFMLEIEAGCADCKGSQADRIKAIAIYESLIHELNINEKSQVLFQLAHLYQISGKTDKAQKLYEDVLKNASNNKIADSILVKSRASLGDIYYQKGQFKEALAQYNLALKSKNLENRAYVLFNKAWCHFNLDQTKTAIETLQDLASHPNMITRIQGNKEGYDEGFHTDITKDLATFYARGNITSKEINIIEQVAPKNQRKVVLSHFAQEADRLGQKRASKQIWDRYLQDSSLTKEEKLSAYVNKTQVNYDGGLIAQSTDDFAAAAEVFKRQSCKKDACEKTQVAMKNYVTELHRSKKLNPDQDLLKAYVIYTNTFPEDRDMQMRAAQVAMDSGNKAEAVKFYRHVVEGRTFTKSEKEEALTSQMGAAELSGNENLKQDAYVYFLKNSNNETKKFEVRYQLAYQKYQQKNLKDAASEFSDLALNKKGSEDLRIKSADLALDALAQMKDDRQIEEKATEFASAIPSKKSEYDALARKSMVNQSALVANNSKSSTGEMNVQLKKIWSTNLAKATAQEKIQFYTNAEVLAHKLNDEEGITKAQLALLSQPGLSESKKQDIYIARAAYHEKKLEFKQAYQWAKKISSKNVAENEFRLATLADLANLQAVAHYNKSLKAGLNNKRALVAKSRLIALSNKPMIELKKHINALKLDAKLLNDTLLTVYSKTSDKRAIEKLAQMKELRYQPIARYFANQKIYDDVVTLQKMFVSSKLKYSPVKALQKSTSQRIALLKQADSLMAKSVRSQDIAAQMASLDLISIQNERLARELLKVPEPKGLNKIQKAQYEKLLLAQLKPYADKSKLAFNQKQELWNSSPALTSLIKEYSEARPEIQKLMNRQMLILAKVSGDGSLKKDLLKALSEPRKSSKDLNMARISVSVNPEDIVALVKLKNLETEIGHPLMVALLETRLNELQKGKRL